jgi:glycosyltransferase involved in cell wall biosynthesis
VSKPLLLIIGKVPPPIGGVTIHVQRLYSKLKKISYPFVFFSLSIKNILIILRVILSVKIVHLHSSNPYIRFILALYCRLLSKKILITYHGNIGRFSIYKNQIDNLSIRLAFVPIALNQGSYMISRSINKNTRLISAFIPPDINELYDSVETEKKIYEFSKNYKLLFFTNAFNVSFDSRGKETYGISQLVNIFFQLPDKGLIFSDPSGNYKKYLETKFSSLPDNLLILNYNHDFITVIRHASVMIRATTTDGDSLSVREALFLGKRVIASDCVSRPNGVILYKTGNQDDLMRIIKTVHLDIDFTLSADSAIDSSLELISLYNEYLKK